MSGLKKWLDEKWVDIGAPKKDGKYQPCGRSKGSKRKKAMDGGMMREGYRSGGKIAKGCGRVMSNRRKKTKTY